jgi:hypothetical protein
MSHEISRSRVAIVVVTAALWLAVAVPSASLGAWSGWAAVPGGGRTYDTPNAVAFGGRLHVFVRGGGNGVYMNTSDGSSWSGWTEVPGNGSTPSGPGAATYRKRLWLLVRGTDDVIYYNRS